MKIYYFIIWSLLFIILWWWGLEELYRTAVGRFSISTLSHIPHSYLSPFCNVETGFFFCIIVRDIFLTVDLWHNLFQSKLNKPGFFNFTLHPVTVLSFSCLVHFLPLLYFHILLFHSSIALAYVCSHTHRHTHTHLHECYKLHFILHFSLVWSCQKQESHFHPFKIGNMQYIWHLRA